MPEVSRRRSRWSQGRGPRETRTSKARTGRRSGLACHRRWNAYVKQQRQGRRRRFTALLHHVDFDLLWLSFYALKRNAAPGVDGVTWQDYEADLESNLQVLHDRVHRGAYRALPSRRKYIPKPDGRQRPLGIAALEDKILQRAVVAVLNAIYEEDFLGFSYGFRPKRSQHDALDALIVGIERKKVNWILGSRRPQTSSGRSATNGCVRFLEHRIGDERILRMIRKWLKAGVLEDRDRDGRRGRHATGGDGFTPAGQRLLALCLRSLGAAVAQAPRHRRHDPRALCR